MLWMADWDSATSASFWAAAMVVASAIDFTTTAEAAALSPCHMPGLLLVTTSPHAGSYGILRTCI